MDRILMIKLRKERVAIEITIVTGLSGAGKSRAIVSLEDIGYYCVDNMPPKLITKFFDMHNGLSNNIDKFAFVVDVRNRDMFGDLFEVLDELKQKNIKYRILYLDADNNTIVKRYKQTRRMHPLLVEKIATTDDAINYERSLLKDIKLNADYIIDTGLLSTAQLKDRITGIFMENKGQAMLVNCMSFGFKNGLPSEADLVFDLRCLPNPYYVDELRPKTGLEKDVKEYVLKWPQAKEMVVKLLDLIDYLIPLYLAEGKSQLVVAIGCTGGKHRSVVFTELITEHLKEKGIRAVASHRDKDRE